MPPLIPEAEAGPSKKRISTFKSNSEGESEYEEEEPIVRRNKKSKLNGHSDKRQINGDKDKGDKRRKLEKKAGELFEMRQDLPFYQGMYHSSWRGGKWADEIGRRAILDEIMGNETTIVCPFHLSSSPWTAWNGERKRRMK
jgi:hypothetical protein